ncbi:hypothetical protein ACJBXL_10350, partial [Streptococcus suis]
SQEFITVFEKVIDHYQEQITIADYLQKTHKIKPVIFEGNDKLTKALEIVEQEHLSKFPILSDKVYQGMDSDKGLTNWLAKARKET